MQPFPSCESTARMRISAGSVKCWCNGAMDRLHRLDRRLRYASSCEIDDGPIQPRIQRVRSLDEWSFRFLLATHKMNRKEQK